MCQPKLAGEDSLFEVEPSRIDFPSRFWLLHRVLHRLGVRSTVRISKMRNHCYVSRSRALPGNALLRGSASLRIASETRLGRQSLQVSGFQGRALEPVGGDPREVSISLESNSKWDTNKQTVFIDLNVGYHSPLRSNFFLAACRNSEPAFAKFSSVSA